MQFVDLVLAQVDIITANFKHPIFLWGIPIFFVLLLILITRTFVRYSMDEEGARKLRRMRVLVFLFRFVALSLLCIALATPFTQLSKESDGNPHAVILVDKSGSMQSYDTAFLPQLSREIGSRMPTSVKEFGTPGESPVGDAILGQDAHVLLISDGNANSGVDLLDVAQVTQENNLSINMITLTPKLDDSAVFVEAPESLPLGYPANIRIIVTSTGDKPVPLQVLVDGKEAYNAPTIGAITITPTFGTGYHRIEAHIASKDARSENNAFYRVVQVLEKPKVLLLAKSRGPLEIALSGIFDTTLMTSMPTDAAQLQEYSAIVINDQPLNRIGNGKQIAEFLRDESGGKYGGGLVVIGGFNSFDRGEYQGSQFETLLPVKVGKAKRSIGENNIVFVIQVSGSTGGTKFDVNTKQTVTEAEPTIETIKAQAVSAINSLNLKNNVGVVAFGVSTQGQSFGSAEELIQHSVVKISEIKPLYTNKQELVENIPRITGGGTTAPDVALRTAVDMLKDKSGDKTIIFLTNGRFCAGLGACEGTPSYENVKSVVQNARRYNIHTQTIGVGSSEAEAIFVKKVDEKALKEIAFVGDSTYDRATNLASLIIKYGDPKEKGFGENFNLVPLSLTHFITKDVDLNAVLNGYNEVVPKDGSRMLVATDAGNPAVVVWNYFNGRVAVVTVFTANGLGPLLQGNNSDLVRNTVLWAVGDPTRKQEVKTTVPLTIVNRKAEITFVSKQPISGNCPDTPLTFERSSGDTYIFAFTPTKPGFGTACSIPYAVNSESEHWKVGINSDLQNAVGITGGSSFTADQVDEIVERIKTVSTRVTTQQTEIRNPFIALAIIIFLIEIFIRRLTNKK
jgi:uncharacterized membrane protein